MAKIIRTAATEPFVEMPDDDMIICRCEEITKGEIRRAVYEGMRTDERDKEMAQDRNGTLPGTDMSEERSEYSSSRAWMLGARPRHDNRTLTGKTGRNGNVLKRHS